MCLDVYVQVMKNIFCLLFFVVFSATRLSLQKKIRKHNIWDAVDLLV